MPVKVLLHCELYVRSIAVFFRYTVSGAYGFIACIAFLRVTMVLHKRNHPKNADYDRTFLLRYFAAKKLCLV